MRTQPFRIFAGIVTSLLFVATVSFGQSVEWDNVNGGGGLSTGTTYTLSGSISQFMVKTTAFAPDTLNHGYQISIPAPPSIDCQNGVGVACDTNACYGPAEKTFTFRNTMCTTPPCDFQRGSTQYYQYLWQNNNTYTHSDILSGFSASSVSGGDWSSSDTLCVGGDCFVTAGQTMTADASSTSDTWYFIARSFNGGQCGTGVGSCEGLTSYDVAELGPYKYDDTPPSFGQVVAVSSTAYTSGTTWVDGTFNITTSGITDTGCSTIASCDYTINGGTNWAAASYLAGACTMTAATCVDTTVMSINMRATDSEGNVAEATAIPVTCDAAAPTVTSTAPAADTYTNNTAVSNGTLVCNDTGSGLHASPYHIQYCDDGAAKGDCTSTGTWLDVSPVGYSSTNSESFTGADGSWYRMRGRCRDRVLNVSALKYSVGYILVDTSAPDNPVVAGYDDSGKSVTLTDGNWYTYDGPTGPYFEWTAPSDNPATSSGVAGYYVYFGTNASADPAAYQTTLNFTNPTTLTSGTTYYLRIKTADNAGNISTAATVFTYRFDTDAPDNPTVAGYDAVTKGTSLTDGNWYNYDGASGPYFEWTAPSDNPATNSGVAGYYVYFGSNSGADPETLGGYQTTLNFTNPTTLTSGTTYYLRFKTKDNAGNISAAATVFTYRFDSDEPDNPTVAGYDDSGKGVTLTDNEWYNYNGPTGPYFEWTAPSDNPGTNSGVAGYYVYFGTNASADPSSYQATLNYTNPTSLTSGSTYYLRIETIDNAGNISAAATVFTYKYDGTAPNNPTVAGYDDSGKGVTLTDGNWYTYDGPTGPYFEWTAPSDNPGTSSGVAGYYVYFGTNASADPAGYQTTLNFTNPTTLTSGTTYYLRIKTADNAGNISAAATVFTYRFDTDAPDNPTVAGYDAVTKGTSLTDGNWYNYDGASGPYFEWVAPSDNPATNSGVAGYYVYFGSNASADPETLGGYQTTLNFTNPTTLTSGTTYYLRFKTKDNAGNISAAATVFTYKFDSDEPNNPTVAGYDDSGKGVTLTDNEWYNYNGPTGPYFEWTAPSDNPGTNSGVAGYYVYFGTNASADPSSYQATLNYTNPTSLTSGSTYYLRIETVDNAGNISAAATVFTYKYDGTAPNNPTVDGYDAVTKSDHLTDGGTYSYNGPTGPYFEWTAPSDNPATNSGVAGYYMYFGTNNSADPETLGSYQTTLNFTNPNSLTPSTTYYLRVKTKDNAGNISSAVTAFTYIYSGGSYLVVTETDYDDTSYGGTLGSTDGATNNPASTLLDGVLNPDGTEYEILRVILYNELDGVTPTNKSVTVTITNAGTTGAIITETDLGGATGIGTTSVTGTLNSGTAYIKVKATSSQADAIVLSATAVGLTGVGGRNQPAYVLLKDPTYSHLGITDLTQVNTDPPNDGPFSLVAGSTVMMPVWNHAGNAVVVAAQYYDPGNPDSKWNLYQLKWNDGTLSWDTTQLTTSDMCVQPYMRYSYTSDDQKVVFSGRYPCVYETTDTPSLMTYLQNTSKDMFAVRSNGADGISGNLDSIDMLSDLGDYHWGDVSWSHNDSVCAGSFGDTMVTSLSYKPNGSAQLYYMNDGDPSSSAGSTFHEGMEGVTQLTNLGSTTFAIQPSWSNDCTKIVFVAWQGYAMDVAKTGIYILDVTAPGAPITTLGDARVTTVHECSTLDCSKNPALFPTFSADDSMISYMVDNGGTFTMYDLLFQGSNRIADIAENFYKPGVNFDNYLEYILDQPTFSPQLVGNNPGNNEFGLVQCFSTTSATPCFNPDNGNLFTYITQKNGGTEGALSFLTLDNISNINNSGGLLFYQGSVAAVFPPGTVDFDFNNDKDGDGVKGTTIGINADTDTVFSVNPAMPTNTPSGAGTRDDMLVSTGEARDFFPDGSKFNGDIRLIFHYCDSDVVPGDGGDGFLDTVQDAACSGSGGSLDENMLFVYYWCEDASGIGCTSGWNKLDATVDGANNTVTVVTNHFSVYDMFNLTRGRVAPQVVAEINIVGLRTFPNPWRSGQGNITFFADGASMVDSVVTNVELKIYDVRGKLVKTIIDAQAGGPTASILDGNPGGYALAQWDAKNNSGKQVASGVYMYVIRVSNSSRTRSQVLKGKLAIVR